MLNPFPVKFQPFFCFDAKKKPNPEHIQMIRSIIGIMNAGGIYIQTNIVSMSNVSEIGFLFRSNVTVRRFRESKTELKQARVILITIFLVAIWLLTFWHSWKARKKELEKESKTELINSHRAFQLGYAALPSGFFIQ